MSNPKDSYLKCDDLDNLPRLMRENYLYENELLNQQLPKVAHVLQIGSMDGRRIISLSKLRPEITFTGLEIEESFIAIAGKNVLQSGLPATFILGDVTSPPNLKPFDYIMCLNNTLGYIPEQSKAVAGMKKLGKKVIISVYGENFSNKLAQNYFASLGLSIDSTRGNAFIMKDFSMIRRYSRKQVELWSSDITQTPVGYFCTL